MKEKKPITNSKLKPVDTKNPDHLRKSLREASNLSRLSGGPGTSDEEIDRIVHLHCDRGLTLEDSINQAEAESEQGVISGTRHTSLH